MLPRTVKECSLMSVIQFLLKEALSGDDSNQALLATKGSLRH